MPENATSKSKPTEMEICFTGIDAVKICHFCKKELENLRTYLRAKVTKEPSKVTIKWDEKYSDSVIEKVDKMKVSLNLLSEEVVKLDVTKAHEVKQLSKQYGEDSGVLIYIFPMDFTVHVVADSYGKLAAALHKTKVILGMVTTSKRGGRSLENTDSSTGNKFYPYLYEARRTENIDGYDNNGSRDNMRDSRNPTGKVSWRSSSSSSSDSDSNFNRQRRGRDENKYHGQRDATSKSKPREMEICFTGIDAVKICHFCKKELENLRTYHRAKITEEPSKVTIKWDEKYSDSVIEKVDKMKESLNLLFEEVVKLDVTKAHKVKQLSKQYGEDSGVLIYIFPMDFTVHVVADSYGKLAAALHKTKISLGIATTPKTGGRSLENTDSSSGNKFYPYLYEARRTENIDEYDNNSSRDNMRDYRNPTGKVSWRSSSPSSSDSDSNFSRQRRGRDENKYHGQRGATSKSKPTELEICFTGIEAVKICHFCMKELENLAAYSCARVTKESSEWSSFKITIKWDEKYSDSVIEKVDKMKESLNLLSEEVVKLDVTKATEVRQLSKQYGEDSGVLIYISAMDFTVHVVADSYDKLSAALHKTKICLGIATTPKRGGRSLENTNSSTGNKFYPYLYEARRTKNIDEYDNNSSRDNMRDYRNQPGKVSWRSSSPSSSDSDSNFSRQRRGRDENKYHGQRGATSKSKPTELEICFTGIEAVKICHFCMKELENLAAYSCARVTKESSEWSSFKITIKWDEKDSDSVIEKVDKMKESLNLLSEEVVKLDVTKATEVRQLSKQYGEDSGVLIYISAMDFTVHVVADSYDKLSAALHKTKISLGIATTPKRGGRSLENTDSSTGNKFYPYLYEARRTENIDEYDNNSSRDNMRDYRNPTGKVSWRSSSPSSSDSDSNFSRQRRGRDENKYHGQRGATSKSKPTELEICFTGIEAVKICHFCMKELENLAAYSCARVTKESSEWSSFKITIRWDEKYSDSVIEKVDKMKESLNLLSEEVVKLDVTKATEVRQLSKQYGEDSGVLIYISPMDFTVHVVADSYDKLSAALHKTKISLGIATTPKTGGRSLENTDSSSGNKFYPYLYEARRTKNIDEYDNNSSRDNMRDYRNPTGKVSWRSSSPSSSDSDSNFNRQRRGRDENKYHGQRGATSKSKPTELEICFTGIEAVKICHFCMKELENLAAYSCARVTKESSERSSFKITIKWDEKYSDSVIEKVDKMKESLNLLSEEVVLLDVSKADEVRQLSKQYSEDSGVLIFISSMDSKVYVIADTFGKLSAALHRVKVCLRKVETTGTPRKLEISFTGIEAVKICHFLKKELENLETYLRAKVTKKASGGLPSKVTIKWDEKYSDDVTEKVDKMKESLNMLSEEVVEFDVTKANEVTQLSEQYSEDSGVLIYTSAMDSKVHVIADTFDKLSAALHRTKVSLSMVTTSKRGGKSSYSQSDLNSQTHSRDENYQRQSVDGGQYSISSDEDFDFQFDFPSGFRLKVYKASITSLQVDAIVNAADCNLVHEEGVARAISNAAGYRLNEESVGYVQANGLLAVGDNCLTTAGRLPYDKVIHAVGPQWPDYSDKEECLMNLYKTVLNVLRRSDKEKFRSVAMPAIGAGIYAVPKELCADMYIQAVVDYVEHGNRYPKELHIIDNDVSLLSLVEKSVKKWQISADSIKPSETLTNYMQDHLAAAEGMGQFPELDCKPKGSDEIVQLQVKQKTSWGGLQRSTLQQSKTGPEPLKYIGQSKTAFGGSPVYEFIIHGVLKVLIYTGNLVKLGNVDAIACSVNDRLSGGLANVISKEAGLSYQAELANIERQGKKSSLYDGKVFICSGGRLRTKKVLHVVIGKTIDSINGDALSRLQLVNQRILQEANTSMLRRFALPLIGAGALRTQKDLAACCHRLAKDVIEFCKNNRTRLHIEELHIIYQDDGGSVMMFDTFRQLESYMQKM